MTMIFELSSKQIMNPDHWNERRGVAKLLNDEYKKLNNYPDQLSSSYVLCYREMDMQKKKLPKKLLKRSFSELATMNKLYCGWWIKLLKPEQNYITIMFSRDRIFGEDQ